MSGRSLARVAKKSKASTRTRWKFASRPRKRVVVAGVTREQVLALLAAAKLPAKKAKD
jgi:hypothetical protein